jgi:hypothetical protein
VARDAIARLDDVNQESAKRVNDKSLVSFEAKPGRSIDLKKLHEALKGTRLAGKTGSVVHYLEVTALGTAERSGDEVLWLVSGTKQAFTLLQAGEIKPEPTKTLANLRDALGQGQKVASVTGRVQGWSGRFPDVLAKYPPGPVARDARPGLTVTDFQVGGE